MAEKPAAPARTDCTHLAGARARRGPTDREARPHADSPQRRTLMKILGWIIGIIFLIGLLVVIGAGKLIF